MGEGGNEREKVEKKGGTRMGMARTKIMSLRLKIRGVAVLLAETSCGTTTGGADQQQR